MSEASSRAERTVDNEKSLQELAWAIAMSEGQFSLIFARCNYAALRERMLHRLHEICSVPIREVVLKPSAKRLYSQIQGELEKEKSSALIILGLESVSDIDNLLTSMNQVREEFRKHCPFPLVVWVNDEIMRKLIRLVPDIESWAKRTVFELPTDALLDDLQQKLDTLFTKVLDLEASRFLPNDAILGFGQSWEIQAALQDLQRRGQNVAGALQADLDFALGREAYIRDKIDTALGHYQHSLEFWQQAAQEPEQQQPKLREGALLFHIGLCYCRNAELHKAENHIYWQKARSYFQQCVDCFEKTGRLDLVTKFIGQLGEVLRRLEAWDELHKLAQKSQPWHETNGNLALLAQNYGFLAEVALHQQHWTKAKALVEKALKIADTATAEQPQHQGWYLLLLARAQRQLKQVKDAIATLEKAKEEEPENNPQLYIQILNELRNLYYEQHQYLEAFEVKQCRRSIEQQFNFRAFVGAGRLQSRRQANFSLARSDYRETLAREIVASGRENDVNRLIERIASTQHKLTVIYGQSGVGKSSLVSAGLLPTLRAQSIDTLDALPVPLRVYTNWAKDLGKSLVRALEKREITPSVIPDSEATIIEQLTQNEHHNLLTVLIFDQFEEFFFFCTEPTKQKQFFKFLGDCLNIPFVKVILSMREDYLHYLLVGNELPQLAVIHNDILNKNILYKVRNFLPQDAKNIIETLTVSSQFPLESALVDEIVQELAGDSREVRPIELQIVGAQLQTEGITNLAEYQERGPKDKLVQRYLGEVIKDCGSENKRTAELVLYFLTNGEKPRPFKSRADLEAQLKALAAELAIKPEQLKAGNSQQLSLVLEIFVKSGLVFKLTDIHINRYQIVHDYLASFIRKPRGIALLEEIKDKFSNEKLVSFQKRQVIAAVFVGLVLILSTASGVGLWRKAESHRQKEEKSKKYAQSLQKEAEKNRILATSKTSEALFASGQRFESLLEAIEAGTQLKKLDWTPTDNKISAQVVAALQQPIYWLEERNRLEGHEGLVWDVSISPDGKTIASASYDGTVRLWQPDGTSSQILNAHKDDEHKDKDRVLCVSFSPDGKVLATASFDKTVKLWKADGKGGFQARPYKTLKGHTDGVYHVSFSPKDEIIATASRDKTVKLWNLDGSLFQTLTGHKDGVNGVSFSPDGKIIATASRDNTVKLWRRTDEGKFEILPYNRIQHRDMVWAVSFSLDGETIATASRDNTVKLWKLDGSLPRTLTGHSDSVLSVSFNPDGKTIASASQDNTVKVWNVENGQLLRTLAGHSNGVYDVSFLPNDRLVSAGADHTLKLWQLGDRKFQKILNGHIGKVWDVTFSPDGKMIASASEDGTVKLWERDSLTNGSNTADYRLLKTLEAHSEEEVLDVSFSPDGRTIATASYDQTVILWTRDGVLQRILQHSDQVFSASFSPDGQTIATGGRDNTVKLWTLDRRLPKILEGLDGHRDWVRDVSFSPDGQIIASASDDTTVKLWRRDGSFLRILEGHNSWVRSVTFSPDGQMIATASEDKTVKLWNRDGTFIRTLEEHRDQVRSVTFSPKGQMIATASDDKTVKLWKLDGTLIRTLTGHRDGIRGVSFSPDGQTLALASADNTVILWDLNELNNLDELVELLEYGCNWLDDYLKTNQTIKEGDGNSATHVEPKLCDGIGTQP